MLQRTASQGCNVRVGDGMGAEYALLNPRGARALGICLPATIPLEVVLVADSSPVPGGDIELVDDYCT